MPAAVTDPFCSVAFFPYKRKSPETDAFVSDAVVDGELQPFKKHASAPTGVLTDRQRKSALFNGMRLGDRVRINSPHSPVRVRVGVDELNGLAAVQFCNCILLPAAFDLGLQNHGQVGIVASIPTYPNTWREIKVWWRIVPVPNFELKTIAYQLCATGEVVKVRSSAISLAKA